MLKQLFALVAVTLTIGACQAQQKAIPSTTPATKGQTFGQAVSAEGAITYTQLLKQLQNKDSVAVKVVGTVDAVCQMKGCWMNITEANQPEMMVKFKDYGFFVPKDIAGRKVVMQGYAYREVTPVDELRHYAEDAGKSKEEIEKITEPKQELKFLATGVLLLDEQSSK
jgi:hypothetical protein